MFEEYHLASFWSWWVQLISSYAHEPFGLLLVILQQIRIQIRSILGSFRNISLIEAVRSIALISFWRHPRIWMKAKVLMIAKPKDSVELTDFRPISILPELSKAFESIVLEHFFKGWVPIRLCFRCTLTTVRQSSCIHHTIRSLMIYNFIYNLLYLSKTLHVE